jgi:N-acetylneuraminic acid mutarotase
MKKARIPAIWVLVLVVGLSVGAAKADLIWTQKADMPTPRWVQTSAVVNGKIYVIGGYTGDPDGIPLSTVEEYDPVTNTWTRRADMPTARCDFVGSSAVVDGKIYVIGGDIWDGNWIPTSTVEAYDPETDTWTRKTDMPTARWGLATCAFNGKVYAIGGYLTGTTGLTTVEVYDPMTDTWTRKADMPKNLWGLCAKVVKGKIYTVGGRPGNKSTPYVQEYDPATDTWTRKTDMLVGASQMGSVVLGDKIIVIGGWLWSMDTPYKTVQMYDTQTDIWTIEDDAPFLRASFSSEVVNNRIYAIGGTDRPHPCPALSTVYELGPVLDFNGDGIVDCADMCIMVDYWGTNEPLCDIGPMPWGDGVVDVEDLKVLTEHLFEEVDDPTLIAHWPLDEIEGMIAHDIVSGNNDLIIGDALWQPACGKVDGALELDGIDDCIISSAGPNSAEKPFSVVSWIKGDTPGQVIISQPGGVNWLAADADGKLMTELKGAGRSTGPLFSEKVITDEQWHRIGLVWDGLHRTLYVDGVVVAEDTQNELMSSNNGLYIGCGSNSTADTFFSGLIDDVRIYNVALTAEEIAALAQ